jgi:hypothetical protein
MPFVSHERRRNGVLRAIAFVLALACVSCGEHGLRPKTVNDVARAWCAAYFANRYGISVEDAARVICVVPEVLAPFLTQAQEGSRRAGPEAEQAAERAGVAR